MRKTFLLLLLLPWPLAAQSTLSIAPQNCVWKQGDDLRWAATDLDESDWQPTTTWPALATPTAFFWLRCRFDPGQLVAAVHPELQVSGDLAWQVFANGRSIGASGNIVTGAHTADLVVDYADAQFLQRNAPVLVAVRMTFTPELNARQQLPGLSLGDAEFQRSSYWSEVYERTQSQWVTWACYALIASAGLFFMALYWFDRTQRYILWISLTWLDLATLRINEFMAAASVNYSSHLEFLLYVLGQNLPIFVILFFFAVNRKPMPIFFRIAVVINFLFEFGLLVAAVLPLRASVALRWFIEVQPTMTTLEIAANLLGAVAAPFAFFPWRSVRRGQTALAIVCLVWMLMDFAYIVVQLPILNLDVESLFLRIQPLRSVAIAAVVVSMTILLVQQLRTTNQERAELHGEMASAREIQQYLIPERLPPTPGLAIHSVYQPSREVGGDFFQVLPDPRDGSTLVVVGDVAGKGLKAGMLAALIVGAIRTAFKFTSDPGSILALLNERLQGRGLVTCLAMRVDRNGSVELANAGHPPPYINGTELPLEGAFPLGALPEISFPIQRFQLSAGESMLLISDGVVEARNAAGELFGFERTRAISTQSADHIAHAAQAFGQEDDITVLTLARA
jgi:Stage II sporulation protein E (SpoIIE)